MNFMKSLVIVATFLSTITYIAKAEINVIASVKPLHSLVAAVMEGVSMPNLIVKGGDYTFDTVVGNDIAQVIIFPTVEGFSTSNIVEKVNGNKN